MKNKKSSMAAKDKVKQEAKLDFITDFDLSMDWAGAIGRSRCVVNSPK
jgi:hypothetical protein